MKTKRSSVFRRMYALAFILITLLGLLFIGITWMATTHFYQESTELLNKDVAAHIAKFTSPYDSQGLDRQKADSVFQSAMVISPSAEVYFLDTTGRVVYFHGSDQDIRLWQLPMDNIQRYITMHGGQYITGPDPRDPSTPKIFSAAAVEGRSGKLGYIYVILGSRQYRNTTQMLFKSEIGVWVIGAFLFIIALSLLLSLYYVDRLQRRFDGVVSVLEKFQQGDFSARFASDAKDDLAPVTQSFNKMADLLLYNIDRLTHSEKERKDFMVNISHDLRTPLAIARGYAETLLLQQEIRQEEGPVPPDGQTAYLQLVTGKIRQVENMVRQLFELAQMESASFEAKKEPFLFAELLQEVLHAIKLTVAEKQLHIECQDCTDGPWIEADIRMMERVIQNLVDNAVSYTREGGQVRIALIREEGFLVFRIDNEGGPLPADLMDWINAGDEGGGADGLQVLRSARPAIGLAIVKKILQLHRFPLEAGVVEPGRLYFSFRMPVYKPEDVSTLEVAAKPEDAAKLEDVI